MFAASYNARRTNMHAIDWAIVAGLLTVLVAAALTDPAVHAQRRGLSRGQPLRRALTGLQRETIDQGSARTGDSGFVAASGSVAGGSGVSTTACG